MTNVATMRANNDVVKFYGMAGDGIQAPGAIVLRVLHGRIRKEFAVHFWNEQDGGFHQGYYTFDFRDAEWKFEQYASRFDPVGLLNMKYLEEREDA